MSTSYTANCRLQMPATADRNWDVNLNANALILDGISAIADFIVTTHEQPSSSLLVDVAPGTYPNASNVSTNYARVSGLTLTGSATNYIYIIVSTGVLTVNQTGFPVGTSIIPVATVAAGPSTITGIADARMPFRPVGTQTSLQLLGGSMNDAGGVVTVHTGTANGTAWAGATTEKQSAYGATPVVQPSGASQAAVGTVNLQAFVVSTGGSAGTTLAAATNSSAMTDSSGGSATTTVADVGASFSQSGLNNIHASILARLAEQRTLNTVLINSITSLGTEVNHAGTDIASLKTLVNAIRSGLVSLGWLKGSA